MRMSRTTKHVLQYARTLVELLQESPLWALPVFEEDAQDMVGLLPYIHRLLVLLPALEDEHVDDARVVHVAILLELAADSVSEVLCCYGDSVHRNNLGCLCMWCEHQSRANSAEAVGG